MDFDIKFDGLDKLIDKIEDFDDVHAMTRAMQDACNIVESAAIDKAPKKTGALRINIKSKVELTGNAIEGIVFTPLEYAPYVEFGTGIYAENGGTSGYWVYVGDKDYDPNRKKSGKRYTLQEAKKIVAIMRSKGLEAYYTNGQHPQPFLRPALNENKDKIINMIKGALR